MTTTREKVAALLPLVEKMHRGHCWIKGADGPRRIQEPFTEFMLAEHCAGRKAYGLCPIAPGTSTTQVACLDFDSHKGEVPWPEMAAMAQEVLATAELCGLAGTPFRSSGGNGIHLIFMWSTPQDARSVREALRQVLTACQLTDGTKGLTHKEVEIFPKQDAVPLDGYGSMFVLPLAGESVLLEGEG
jgi:hypothetical protein